MVIGICDDEHKECERIEAFVKDYSSQEGLHVETISYRPDDMRRILETAVKEMKQSGKAMADTAGAAYDRADIPEVTRRVEACEDKPGESQIAKWDIMIMDIEFKNRDYNGIELVEMINQANKHCQIIYLTHVLSFAPEVYDTDHCYFVMKNNMEHMLPRALDKARKLHQMAASQKPLEIMSGGHTVYIREEDIRYVEKSQRQTIVHTGGDVFACYESISAIAKRLSRNVVRCHGGYLVNLSHITYLGSDKIIVDLPDAEIPVGKTYREHTKRAYLAYWMNRM